MRLHQTPAGTRPTRGVRGFSLVEVTLALGILAFCVIPLIGLIPTGLNAQQSAQERARATTALTMLATAVRSAKADPVISGKYNLPVYFSDSATPVSFTVGGATPPPRTYQILEDGTIRKSGDKTPARETMYVQIIPPATDAQLGQTNTNGVGSTSAVSFYALVVWPARSSDTPDINLSALANRQGSVESFITYVPTR